MSQYWVGRAGQQYGPFDEAALRSGFQSGKLAAADLVWREGMSEWVPAASVFGAHAAAPEFVAPPPTPAPAPPLSGRAPVASREIATTHAATADYGLFLLGIPAVATLLIWLWVGNMNLLQGPSETLALITIATVAGTAVLAAIEASKAGMTTNRAEGTYSPTAWFFILLLLWIVGYPLYLFKRRLCGLKNLLGAGLAVAIIFTLSSVLMGSAIEAKKQEIRQGLQDMERAFRSLQR